MAKHRDKLIDFAIFSSGRELYGYADVTLPDIEFISDTIKGCLLYTSPSPRDCS
jgi:hypothetical protein